MEESSPGFRYIGYVAARWRTIALSCAVAVTLAAILSVSMTRQYTATSRILIEPPAGVDVRSATSVSPIYLESLRTYEAFAESDSLFSKAIDKFNLRALFGGGAIESLKKRVLKVAIVRNTRILEISATLPDPHRAQVLAQFIAQASVDLNHTLSVAGSQDLVQAIEAEQRTARAEVEQIDAEWAKLLLREPVADLQAQKQAAAELRAKLEEQLTSAQVELAGAVERAKEAAPSDLPQIRSEQSDTRTRIGELQRQVDVLDKQSAAREILLAERLSHQDKLQAERKGRATALATIEGRLVEARSDAGYRGERLRIIDPGIVPEKPSSPNIPLNIAAALLLGFALPVIYLALQMNFREERVREGHAIHALRKTR